ncbi:MAG: protein kinase domain-containing protein [Planctomycetaceae bacterium]
MAPEQSRGQSDHLGPATDVYALGAILYELLTGRPPFRRSTAMETLLASSFELPVSPARLEPAIPRDLETICLKCLEKEPRLRFASAAELADELERVATHRPIVSRPPGSWGRLYRACRRNPGPSALAGLVGLLLVLGVCGAALFLRNEVRLRRAAVLARNQAEEQRAEAIRQRHEAELARSQAVLQRNRADENLRLAQSYLARSAEMLAPDTSTPDQVTENEMRLREELERIAAELQADFAERQPEESELTLARAEALRRRVYWQQLRRTAKSLEPDDSIEVLREALRLAELPEAREQHPGQADLLRLRIQSDLSRLLQVQGESGALEMGVAALEGTRRLLEERPGDEELLLLMCDLHRILPQLAGSQGKFIAEIRQGRAEVLQQAGNAPLSARLCERLLLMWRTELLFSQSRQDHFQEMATLREIHAFLASNPATSEPTRSLPFLAMRACSELGRALSREGRWDEAVTVLKQAQRPTLRKRTTAEDHFKRTLLDHDWLLAEALVQTGQPAEAVEIYRELIRASPAEAEAIVARISRLIPLLQLQQLSVVRSELQELSRIPRMEGDVALVIAERSLDLLDAWGERPGREELHDELQPLVLLMLERAFYRGPKRRAQAAAVLSESRWRKCVDSAALEALQQKLAGPEEESTP